MEIVLDPLKVLYNIHFAEPVKLQLLAVALVLLIFNFTAWLAWFYRRPKRTHGSRYRFFGGYMFWFLSTISLALLITAWARPFIAEGNVVVKRGNAEVVFIVDSSGSMFLKDTGLARIDIATREINNLLSMEILRDGDRVSCFILGKTGLPRIPLTNDLSAFAGEISRIGRPVTLKGGNIYWGSDVGSTLARVYASLDRQDMFTEFGDKEVKNWTPKIRQNRIVVLLSDGDFFNYDEEEATLEAEDRKTFEHGLNEFRKRGLKIYSIGIGTKVGAKMLDVLKDYKREEEYDIQLEKDLEGQESHLNTSDLEYIRNVTGAEKLFLIENDRTDASNFLKTVIDAKRNIYVEPGINQEKEELWLHFSLIALVFFGLAIKFN